MNKKRTAFYIVLIILVGLAAVTFGNNPIIAKKQLDLFIINGILQKEEDVNVTEWSLHAREKMGNVKSLSDAKAVLAELQEKYPDAKWTETESSSSWQAKALLSAEGNKEESITVTASLTTQTAQSYVIYEMKGKELSDQFSKKLKKDIEEKVSAIFRGKPTIFSCIKGEFNDKISRSLPYYVNHLLDAFQAKQIEALEEDDFVSASAITSIFDEKIQDNNKAMNLQLGIRTQGMGGKTTFVVGTPIITIEY
jgi:hypothetical protein